VTTQNFRSRLVFPGQLAPRAGSLLNLACDNELTLRAPSDTTGQSWIDPNAASPLSVPGLPQLKGRLAFASDNQRTPYNVDPLNLGPRLGIAYRTKGDIVIRTGFGVFFEAIKGARRAPVAAALWPSTGTRRSCCLIKATAPLPGAVFRNPIPQGIQLPPGNSQGLLTGLGWASAVPSGLETTHHTCRPGTSACSTSLRAAFCRRELRWHQGNAPVLRWSQ